MAAKVRPSTRRMLPEPTVTTNDLAGAGAGPARERPRRRVRLLFTRDCGYRVFQNGRFLADSPAPRRLHVQRAKKRRLLTVKMGENGRETVRPIQRPVRRRLDAAEDENEKLQEEVDRCSEAQARQSNGNVSFL